MSGAFGSTPPTVKAHCNIVGHEGSFRDAAGLSRLRILRT